MRSISIEELKRVFPKRHRDFKEFYETQFFEIMSKLPNEYWLSKKALDNLVFKCHTVPGNRMTSGFSHDGKIYILELESIKLNDKLVNKAKCKVIET